MKNLILLLFVGCFSLATFNTFAQDSVTTEPAETILTADVPEAPAQDAQSTATMIMTACAIIGALVRIIYQTKKGIKNPENSSPTTFSWDYWLRNNLLPKITVTLAFILSILAPFKLPNSPIGLVILGVVSFGVGLFIDYLADLAKDLPKASKS